MSKEPNNIDRLIREKLDGFEMTPPPSVWKNTSSSLQGGKRKRFVLWFALGFAAVAILGTGAYFYSILDSDKEQIASTNTSDETIESTQQNPELENNSAFDLNNSQLSNDAQSSETGSNRNTTENFPDSGNGASTEGTQGISNASGGNSGIQVKGSGANTGKQTSKNSSGNDSSFKQPQLLGDQSSSQNGGDSHLAIGSDLDAQDLSNGDDELASTSQSEKKDNLQDEKTNPLNSLKSDFNLSYNSLPINSSELFKHKIPSMVANKVEDSLPPVIPFWKSLSVEGTIGMSTFKNQPKKSTSQPILDALNGVASGQRSFDFRLGLNYHFTDRFSFQSGVHYNAASENYSFNSSEIITLTQIDTISISIDSMMMDTTYITNTVSYDSTIVTANNNQNTYRIFTLPFQFAWSQPISTRGILEFSLGGEIGIFGKNTGAIIVDQTNFALSPPKGYHTTGMLSVGGSVKYLHRCDEHHSVYVEPWAQFGVTNHSTPSINYETLRRRYGIRVGYRFYF